MTNIIYVTSIKNTRLRQHMMKCARWRTLFKLLHSFDAHRMICWPL